MARSIVESLSKAVVDLTEEAPIRVLHVDDEAGFLKSAKQCLETQGAFRVETASSVEEASEKLKKKKFDLVISDYVMPGKDGLQFLQELREEGNNVPFIMFTGKGREEVAIKALNLGADRYINKTGYPETVYGELAHSIKQAVEKGAISIKLDRSLKSIKKRSDELATLMESSIEMMQKKDLHGRLKAIAATVRKVGWRRVVISVRDENLEIVNIVTEGLTRKEAKLLMERKAPGNVWRERLGPKFDRFKIGEFYYLPWSDPWVREKVHHVSPDSEEVTTYAGVLSRLSLEEMVNWHPQDMLYAPLRLPDGRIVGIMSIDDPLDGRQPTKESLIPLELFLYQAAVAIENAQLIDNLHTREDSLRKSEERFVQVAENAQEWIWEVDTNGLYTYASPVVENILGYKPDEIIAKKHFYDLFHPEDREELKRGAFEVFARREVFQQFLNRNVHKNGKTVWLATSGVPIIDEKGDLLGYRGADSDITERQKARETLKESEEKFRNIVELAPDGIITIDKKGVITSVNTAFSKLTGYSKDEIVGKHFIKLGTMRTRDFPQYMKLMSSALRGKLPPPFEFPYTRKDGTTGWGEAHAGLLKEDDKTVGFQAILREITQRKEAQSALGESEEKYRTLMEETPIGICNLDIKGNITYINKRFEEITGYSKREVLGRSSLNLLRETVLMPKENLKLITKRIRSRMMGSPTRPITFPLRRKDGGLRWLEGESKLIKRYGVPVGLQAILRDITERKKTDEKVRENQQKFEQLFKSNPEAAVYVDSDFHILGINPRFNELFGYSLKEIKGKHINDVVVPKDKMEDAELLDKKARKGYAYHDTVRKRKDGTLVPVSISAAPVTVDYQLVGCVGVYKDISQLKNTERALKKSLEKMQILNDKLSVVGKLARHDVRNKLSVVANNTYLAKQMVTGSHKALEYLEDIESAVRQTVRIFDFARTYEKLGMEELVYTNVEKSLKKAIMLFSDLHGAKIVNNCHGLTVLADSLLQQLFYNLIDNSLKHGQNVSQIKAYHEETEKDKLKLVYEDDGIGIPEAEKEKIFMEGYGKDTGYGLYLIRKMCGVYGWTIKETGRQGKGVQFTITIPKMNKIGKIAFQLQ